MTCKGRPNRSNAVQSPPSNWVVFEAQAVLK